MKRPLLRFLLLGTLLYVGDLVVAASFENEAPLVPLVGPVSDDEVWLHEAFSRGYHESDAIVRRRLARNMRFAGGEEDRDDAELVDDAIALGMHETDLIVRRRLIQKMKLLTHERVRRIEPTDAELERFMVDNEARFTEPARIRLTQIYFREASDAAATLAAGLPEPDAAAGIGDALPIPRHLPPHSRAELARQLGPAFAEEAFEVPLDRWQGPIASAYGHHLVYATERRAAVRSKLATVRSEAREGLLYERAQAAEARELARLREKYGVARPSAVSGSSTPIGPESGSREGDS